MFVKIYEEVYKKVPRSLLEIQSKYSSSEQNEPIRRNLFTANLSFFTFQDKFLIF